MEINFSDLEKKIEEKRRQNKTLENQIGQIKDFWVKNLDVFPKTLSNYSIREYTYSTAYGGSTDTTI